MNDIARERFETMSWHDALLLHLHVDRRAPGTRDVVTLHIQWVDGQTSFVSFGDCYKLEANMNFGIIAAESIRSAHCILDSPRVAEERRKWAQLGVSLDDLMSFEFEMNSTGSVVRVLARSFEIEQSTA